MKSYIRRKWLNPPASCNNGWIKYGIDIDKKWVHWSSVEFRLADCHRVVGFDFDVINEQARKEALNKARIIKESVDEFYASMQQLCAEAEKDEKRELAARKKEGKKNG